MIRHRIRKDMNTMNIERRDMTKAAIKSDFLNRVSSSPRRAALASRRLLSLGFPFLMAGAWGCSPGMPPEGAAEEAEYTRVINVEVSTVEIESFTEVIRITGTVQANQDVTISAEESGVVREILVDKGRRVQEGQAIFRLDDQLLSAQVDQGRALSEMARETWERRKRLYEEDRVGSELAYLEAKYGSEQASANLKLLEERLARTIIRAPIAGILESREIEVGTMVGVGTRVARIVDTNPVKITGGVPERYAADVRTGTETTITLDVLPEDTFRAQISYVGAVVNPGNRTFPIELRLGNAGGIIKPEMVANVQVVRRTIEEAIVVPQEALVRTEEGYQVFVVETEGDVDVVRSRPVELGSGQENKVVIQSGIEAGERLVVVGQHSVAAGDRVRVVGER